MLKGITGLKANKMETEYDDFFAKTPQAMPLYKFAARKGKEEK